MKWCRSLLTILLLFKLHKKNATALPKEYMANIKKVKDAMLWLQLHNPQHTNIKINQTNQYYFQISIINATSNVYDRYID
jgi:hypothetical protein